MPAGSRRSSPGHGAASTCSISAPRSAAPASASTPPKRRRCAAELARMTDAHRRTLDQLSTGVAIFDADQRADVLQRRLSLARGSSTPASSTRRRPISAVLDRLRARASCPRSRTSGNGRPRCTRPIAPSRPRSTIWHLPDGRTLRVVTTPNPEGGVTYLFDDVTERLDLRAPLRGADPRAGRDARQPGRGGRGVRQRRPPAAVQSRRSPACGGSTRRSLGRAAAHRDGDRTGAGAATTTMTRSGSALRAHGDRDRQPRGDQRAPRAPRRQRARSAPRCRCRTAPPWSRSRTSPTRSTSSARCASATRRWKTPTGSRSISSTTCPTSCARRSPTSSASRICSASRRPGR